MKISTICFPMNEEKILLGMKKRGFGEGKWNGFGGKVQEGESIEDTAIRELNEEIGISADKNNLEKSAVIKFFDGKELVFECHIFIVKNWQGEPVESEEMKPSWFTLEKVPYSEMWVSDREWIPLVLSGKKFEGKVDFDLKENTLRDFSYTEVV